METIPTPESKIDLTQFESIAGAESPSTPLSAALTEETIARAIEEIEQPDGQAA